MEENKSKIKEYADGWITERAGTDVPGFLKLAFIVIAAGCLGYLIIFMNGEVDHPDRGQLVRAFNAATETSGTLMYAVAAMIVVFGIVVVAFSFGKPHD
ncbi:MAG TPA: hypothetical protein VMH28_01675 [Candidatus Acidoferrales bacterium]|nr:hypothetical protein [Candidatus Acidoferrales bacterium]